MPLAQLKPAFPEFDAAPRAPLTADVEQMTAAPSPARLLQQRLERSAGLAVAIHSDKWPLRQRAALIVGASVALWAALLSGAQQAVQIIA